MSRSIEIVCHKGANQYAPENTFAAAQRCIEWGVDYVEIDVWTSRDGVFYLMHDATVDRTTNRSGHLLALRSDEIDKLDAGSWFGPQFASERVPRLEEFLRWIKGKARVFIDVKFAHPQNLIDLLHATEMEDACFLWSGSDWMMQLFRALDPSVALMINVRSADEVVEAADRYQAQIVGVELGDMRRELVDACRARGIKIMVTQFERDTEAFRQIIRWEVDMVNLDHADAFLAELNNP
ncbi:MAG: glycerophosphodiester phosphodiesterase family protein [Spirochaetaceae bacterium]|nr:glycerophosphodiester phosphodiesterase family protein [Spirochaetaceae bacterium]